MTHSHRLAIAFAILVALPTVWLAGCGGADSDANPGPVAPVVDEEQSSFESSADCFDYFSWREAQDALDLDAGLADDLDPDGDGGACDDVAQSEYENGWAEGYAEACQAIFFESPDGTLYDDGVGYDALDCELAEPGPDFWSYPDAPFDEPEAVGAREAWNAACGQTFVYVVGSDLFWGDGEVVVTQTDCEMQNPY